MATQIWVNTGSGNGSFPDGTKPLHESEFINYQWGLVAFNWRQYSITENIEDTIFDMNLKINN